MANQNDQLKQAQTVFGTICKYLDAHDWKYEKDEDELSVRLTTKGEDLIIPIAIRINTQLMIVSIISPIPIEVPEDKRVGMTIAVTAANYTIVDGSFDYSVNNGAIVYRLTTSYRDSIISANLIEYLLLCTCVTADEYNDKFEKVIKDDLNAGEMLELIYGKEEN